MKGRGVKYYAQQIYQSGSPIPYIITLLVGTFILLSFCRVFNVASYEYITSILTLPPKFAAWLYQPWSVFTYFIVYTHFFSLLFDCLWLFWIGSLFLNFQSRRHFLFILSGGIILGAISFLVFSSISTFSTADHSSTIVFGIAAVLAGLIVLIPKLEVSLFLFGRVQLKIIAYVYFAIAILFPLKEGNYSISISYIVAITFGVLCMRALRNGVDWSKILQKKEKQLKVVYGDKDLDKVNKKSIPNQDMVDKVLDKISASGYESLSTKEKEILFRASKEQ